VTVVKRIVHVYGNIRSIIERTAVLKCYTICDKRNMAYIIINALHIFYPHEYELSINTCDI